MYPAVDSCGYCPLIRVNAWRKRYKGNMINLYIQERAL